ncbi:RNA polymerase sigma factor [Paenibacillus alkalitolerans]|uniref:RNA polymerase sigma factor n=1 Tax=Paenibacillus alkalitolerans TaxID=2799335 RepID=UPI0018F41982|nr:sigma-70 family RNA polymerase sigma factor [Paenibacillus alkalitolerans]
MKSDILLLFCADYYSLNEKLQKELYYEFYKTVYHLVMYFVRDHGLTEDIIQEAFFKSINKIPKDLTEPQMLAWIKKTTKNTTFTFLRKQKRYRNELDSESVFISEELSATSADDNVEKKVELKFFTSMIENCLTHLKPEFAVIVEMRWRRGMSYREIAEELDTTEAVIKQKLYRARTALKKRIKKMGGWGDE